MTCLHKLFSNLLFARYIMKRCQQKCDRWIDIIVVMLYACKIHQQTNRFSTNLAEVFVGFAFLHAATHVQYILGPMPCNSTSCIMNIILFVFLKAYANYLHYQHNMLPSASVLRSHCRTPNRCIPLHHETLKLIHSIINAYLWMIKYYQTLRIRNSKYLWDLDFWLSRLDPRNECADFISRFIWCGYHAYVCRD